MAKPLAKPVWVALISLRKLFIRSLFKWLKKGLHIVGLVLSRVLCQQKKWLGFVPLADRAALSILSASQRGNL